jgi:hypothetical protein
VDEKMLRGCSDRVTSECLANIAWSLARNEDRSFELGQLAQRFARLRQWGRADELLKRVPPKDATSATSSFRHVAAEQLAVAIASGDLSALRSVQDKVVLSWAAARLLGYPARTSIVSGDRIGRRLNEGFWLTIIQADRSRSLALVDHWERITRDDDANLHKERLASNLLLLDEPARARRIAERIVPKADDVGRNLVELWLRLGDPDRALAVIKSLNSRHKGLFKIIVARSLHDRGKSAEAIAVALEAAGDGNRLMSAQFLVDIGRKDLVTQISLEAERLSENPNPFRPFDLSEAGAIHGLAGNEQECLRFQARALGAEPKPGEVVAWGLITGPVMYRGGKFDLGPELMQQVAARRFLCGDQTALKDMDNRWLGRNYCEYYRRGKVKPRDIDARPHKRNDDDAPRSFVVESAAECHFERSENAMADPLHQRLADEAKSSGDFHLAKSAAELTCVYRSQKHCAEALHAVARILIASAAKRNLPAQQVAEFAVIWRHRVAER